MKTSNCFDASDIDRIVLHRPLAEIDIEITRAKVMVAVEETPHVLRYWQDYLEIHEEARDIAEWCMMYDVPTVQPRPISKDYRMPEMVEALKEMGGEVTHIRNQLKEMRAKKKPHTYKYT